MSRLLGDIIRGLVKSKEETRRQGLEIVSAIAKQPLLPELINELNNYPSLVKKLCNLMVYGTLMTTMEKH